MVAMIPSLDGVVCFKGHVVACTPRWHSQGLIIGLEDDAGGASTTVTKFEMLTFPEEAYYWSRSHHEFEVDSVVVAYDSMVTPTLEIKVDDTSDRNVLKEKMVPGYDRTLRVTVLRSLSRTEKPRFCQSRVPPLMLWKNMSRPAHRCRLICGYGSYGAVWKPIFRLRDCRLNRGMVYVIG
jgi:protease II